MNVGPAELNTRETMPKPDSIDKTLQRGPTDRGRELESQTPAGNDNDNENHDDASLDESGNEGDQS